MGEKTEMRTKKVKDSASFLAVWAEKGEECSVREGENG